MLLKEALTVDYNNIVVTAHKKGLTQSLDTKISSFASDYTIIKFKVSFQTEKLSVVG